MKTKRYNAQLTKYFATVIINEGKKYYSDKFNTNDHECSIENLFEWLADSRIGKNNNPTHSIVLFETKLSIENDELEDAIMEMSEREKYYIINKFVFGLTDKEIGESLGISRQAVNNFKQRLFKRIRTSADKKY